MLLPRRSLAVIGSALTGIVHSSGSPWCDDFVGAPDDSERAVEVPWAASAIGSCVGFWLDVGHAYAEPRYWESIPTNGWRKHLRYGYGLDVVPAQHPHRLDAEISADVREYDFDSLPKLALITCISTLEHIGCDNTLYHESMGRREGPSDIQREVVTRLIGALSHRGRLLVSVPFGTFEDHGWFLQYTHEMIGALADAALARHGILSSEAYYELIAAGWKRSNAEQMRDLAYRTDEHRAAGVALLEFVRR